MKTILAALASVALIAAPITASAQHGGGGGGGWHGGGGGWRGGGGGWHGGGGWRGGGFRGGGFRGGGYYRGGGFYGGGYPYFLGGLAFGLAFSDPWIYDYPAYYGWGPAWGPDYYDYDDDYDGPPPGAHGPGAAPSAPQGQAPTRPACGSWVWDASRGKYNWVGC